LNEQDLSVQVNSLEAVCDQVLQNLNVAPLRQTQQEQQDRTMRFAGELLSDKSALLIRVHQTPADATNPAGPGQCKVLVNTADFMFAGHVVSILQKSLA